MMDAKETPLTDLLRIPLDARLCYENSPTSHSCIPVGLYCNRAADTIELLHGQLTKAQALVTELCLTAAHRRDEVEEKHRLNMEYADEIERLRTELAEANAERLEQARQLEISRSVEAMLCLAGAAQRDMLGEFGVHRASCAIRNRSSVPVGAPHFPCDCGLHAAIGRRRE